jgi:muramoyltetrapeptide carboxypeptidase
VTGHVVPAKLGPGSHVRIVAPARSLAIIGDDTRRIAERRLRELGLILSFGAHVDDMDDFNSSSPEGRAEDLMAAFTDPAVDGILTVIGGYSSNELLGLLDWDVIRSNAKVFCGYSDITALQLAILRRAGVVTYSGPHFSTFGMEHHFDRTLEWFRRCVFDHQPFDVHPSPTWSDDAWFLDQANRRIEPNAGWIHLRDGQATGPLVGGNLSTIGLLSGTPYFPDLAGHLLWIEDDLESPPWTLRRNLVSLSQQPGFDRINGLVIGRFQRLSGVEPHHVAQIVDACVPPGIPVLAGVDIGHTDPMLTLPVGGSAELVIDGPRARLTILEH